MYQTEAKASMSSIFTCSHRNSLTCLATCWWRPGGLAGCCAGVCGATEWQQAWRWPAAAGGWSSGSSPAEWCWDESRRPLAREPTSWGRSGSGSPQPPWSHPPEPDGRRIKISQLLNTLGVTRVCFQNFWSQKHFFCYIFLLFCYMAIYKTVNYMAKEQGYCYNSCFILFFIVWFNFFLLGWI